MVEHCYGKQRDVPGKVAQRLKEGKLNELGTDLRGVYHEPWADIKPWIILTGTTYFGEVSTKIAIQRLFRAIRISRNIRAAHTSQEDAKISGIHIVVLVKLGAPAGNCGWRYVRTGKTCLEPAEIIQINILVHIMVGGQRQGAASRGSASRFAAAEMPPPRQAVAFVNGLNAARIRETAGARLRIADTVPQNDVVVTWNRAAGHTHGVIAGRIIFACPVG